MYVCHEFSNLNLEDFEASHWSAAGWPAAAFLLVEWPAAPAGRDLKCYKIVVNMSHGNGSSTLIFQVMGILRPVPDSTDKMLKLSHSNMAGCNSLYGSNFDFRMTYAGPEGPFQPSAGARKRMAVGHPNFSSSKFHEGF